MKDYRVEVIDGPNNCEQYAVKAGTPQGAIADALRKAATESHACTPLHDNNIPLSYPEGATRVQITVTVWEDTDRAEYMGKINQAKKDVDRIVAGLDSGGDLSDYYNEINHASCVLDTLAGMV